MKINVTKFECFGISTSHKARVLYEDENAEGDGLIYVDITVKYLKPRIGIDFRAIVGQALFPGSVYSDGVNTYYANSVHEIINTQRDVESFSIPETLTEIYRTFSEKTKH